MAMGAGHELDAMGVGWCSVWLEAWFIEPFRILEPTSFLQPREASGTTELPMAMTT